MSSKLQDLALTPSKVDTTLFPFDKSGITMLIQIYVYDIIVASSSFQATAKLIHKLSTNFALKDLGDLHFFLGSEVKRCSNGLILTQETYAADCLPKVGMLQCTTCPTPLSISDKLSLTRTLGSEDITQYRSIIGDTT
jgi:hypothetical protein